MELDHFAVALLVLRPDAPRLDERAEDALQDAHLAFLANLHRAGAIQPKRASLGWYCGLWPRGACGQGVARFGIHDCDWRSPCPGAGFHDNPKGRSAPSGSCLVDGG
jgi:hypothetical protein